MLVGCHVGIWLVLEGVLSLVRLPWLDIRTTTSSHPPPLIRMNWNFITRAFLAFSTWTFADSAEHKPQEQPPYYIHKSQGPDKYVLLSHVNKNSGPNQQIPIISDNELRVATYNVRFHKGIFIPEAESNDFKKMQATVIVLQGVIADTSGERQAFNDVLSSFGYKYQEYSVHYDIGSPRHVIASKVPLKRLFQTDLVGRGQVLLGVEADFNGQKVAILGTQLASGNHNKEGGLDKIQVQQSNMIIGIIKKQVEPAYSHYLLAGDMNSVWDSQAIKVFRDSGLLYETFASAEAPPPNYKRQDGTTTNCIFASHGLAADIIGSYTYQTTNDDHLPVLADFSKPLKQLSVKSIEPSTVNWFRWCIIGLSGLAILGVASGLILYFVRRSSPPAKPESF